MAHRGPADEQLPTKVSCFGTHRLIYLLHHLHFAAHGSPGRRQSHKEPEQALPDRNRPDLQAATARAHSIAASGPATTSATGKPAARSGRAAVLQATVFEAALLATFAVDRHLPDVAAFLAVASSQVGDLRDRVPNTGTATSCKASRYSSRLTVWSASSDATVWARRHWCAPSASGRTALDV